MLKEGNYDRSISISTDHPQSSSSNNAHISDDSSATVSAPMMSPPVAQIQQIHQYLDNLFATPTDNLQNAFTLLLSMISAQDDKYQQLSSYHTALEDQNQTLLKRVDQVQQSNLEMMQRIHTQEQRERECEDLLSDLKFIKERINRVEQESEGFLSQFGKVRDCCHGMDRDLGELKEEVKVMAHNLQLDTAGIIDDHHDASQQDIPSSPVSSVTSDHFQSDGASMRKKGETEKDSQDDSSDDGSDDNNYFTDEQINKDNGNEDDDIHTDDNSAAETYHPQSTSTLEDSPRQKCEGQITQPNKSDINPQHLTQRKASDTHTLPQKIHQTLSRRKLKVNETLAARLKKLENDKMFLKQELSDIKATLVGFDANKNNNNDVTEVEEVKKRVSLVEYFLSGFGAVHGDVIKNVPENGLQSTRSLPSILNFGAKSDGTHEVLHLSINCDGLNQLKCDDDARSLSDEKDEVGTELLSSRSTTASGGEPPGGSEEQEDRFQRSRGNSDTSISDTVLKETEVLDSVVVLDDEKIETQKLRKSENASETSRIECLPSSDLDKKEQKPGIDHHFTVMPPRDTREERQRPTSHGRLLKHLLDQENRYQTIVTDISSRLQDLEQECKDRVSRKSMEKFVSLNKVENVDAEDNQAMCETEYGENDFSEELDSIREAIGEMSDSIDSKISRDMLQKEVEAYLLRASLSSKNNDSDTADIEFNEKSLKQFHIDTQRQLRFLNENKLDRDAFHKELHKSRNELSKSFADSMLAIDSRVEDSLSGMQLTVRECKDAIQHFGGRPFTPSSSSDDMDIDERIKSATEAMQSSLNEVISSRLQGLEEVEDEMEKITSQLEEKPGQEQINRMLRDLENSVMKHIGIDDEVNSIVDNMKSELKTRMTKEQVLALVKHLLRGAKEGITKSGSSLMVGYRCIGCNGVHPRGVNQHVAPKVNHNAMPHGRSASTTPFSHCKYNSDLSLPRSGKRRTLHPLHVHRPHKGARTMPGSFGFRRPRARTAMTVDAYMSRNVVKRTR